MSLSPAVRAAAISPDGKTVLTLVGSEMKWTGKINKTELVDAAAVRQIGILRSDPTKYWIVAEKLVVGGLVSDLPRPLEVTSASNTEILMFVRTMDDECAAVSYSPPKMPMTLAMRDDRFVVSLDGTTFAVAGRSDAIEVIKRTAAGAVHSHRLWSGLTHLLRIKFLKISADGNVVAAAYPYRSIIVFRDKKLAMDVTDHGEAIEALELSKNAPAQYLFVSSRSGDCIRVYDTIAAKPMRFIGGQHADQLSASDDGHTLVFVFGGELRVYRSFDQFFDQTVAVSGHNAFGRFLDRDGDHAIWFRVASFVQPWEHNDGT